MSRVKKTGIVVDSWKRQGFESALRGGGFESFEVFDSPPEAMPGTVFFKVPVFSNAELMKLAELVRRTDFNLKNQN